MQLHSKLQHNKLLNRYEFRGLLVMETAFHVGTGQTSPATDTGVVRDYQGRPFIPGSSLKGALRSSIERRVEWLGLYSCYLENRGCFGNIDEDWRRQSLEKRVQDMERDFMEGGLCDVCKVFGSSVLGGKVQVDDLPLAQPFEQLANSLVEVRDGVGIDRDSGTAVENLKFDYEVVPSQTAFRFYVTAENLVHPQDTALLALGLLELMNGATPLGGKSSRGLGRCRLHLENVFLFDFEKKDTLKSELMLDYLKPPHDRQHGKVENPRAFLEGKIRSFLERSHAQATR